MMLNKKMKWITPLDRMPELPAMNESSAYIALGSCFANHIDHYFSTNKIQGLCNPFGICYDPLSMERHLSWALGELDLQETHWVEKDGYFAHLDFHTDCNRSTQEEMERYMRDQKESFVRSIKRAEVAILTLGSAWTFRYLASDTRIANCHALPGGLFEKEFLNYADVVQSLSRTCELIRSVNEYISIVFTVSPVRHIRYGLVENSRSKSVLIAAIHDCINTELNTHYFPAYEIMMDELRDYRFYKKDLVHPSAEAVAHVVNYWTEASFTEELIRRNQLISEIHQLLHHKPRFPRSQAYKKHLERTTEKIMIAESTYPDLNWTEEHTALHLLKEKTK